VSFIARAGALAQARRRKAVTAKRRKEPKSAGRRNSSAADQEAEVAGLTRKLTEAREQQTAEACEQFWRSRC